MRLDPHVVFDIGRIGSRLNMYDCLVRWVGNPPELKLWLADKIDIAPDGVTYTVTMKPGAKFHDGNPITADDVVFSMERILANSRLLRQNDKSGDIGAGWLARN